MLGHVRDFYVRLYNTGQSFRTEEAEAFCDNIDIPILSAAERELCEGKVTDTEIKNAIKQMKRGSSPGLDGIPLEFYIIFQSQLIGLLKTAFNEALEHKGLSHFQRRSVMTLIHKGKDLSKTDISNYRPISITTIEYRMLVKVLSYRLSKVIGKLISTDQCGFIKGRSCADVIRGLQDSIEHCKQRSISGALISLDYRKAFDSIKDFIIFALQKFGFGTFFIKAVGFLFADREACIQIRGWLSEAFSQTNGILQGCPISPQLFVLALEILACKIRETGQITGIPIINTRSAEIKFNKLFQFADDMTLTLTGDKSIYVSLEIIGAFGNFSGLQLNMGKTMGLWIGNWKFRRKDFMGIAFANQKIKVLGVWISNDTAIEDIEENYKERINKARRIIATWKKRQLSLVGKVLIIKSLVASQFLYIMRVCILPNKVITEINSLIFKFLWSNSESGRAIEKVKRKILIKQHMDGGLEMVDMNTVQMASALSWIPKLLGQEKAMAWHYIPQFAISQIIPSMGALQCNCSYEELQVIDKDKLPTFWQKTLQLWYNNIVKPFGVNGFSQYVWNNTNIMFKGKTLYIHRWACSGLNTIADIYNIDRVPNTNRIQAVMGQTQLTSFEMHSVIHATHNQTSYTQNIDIRGKPLALMTYRCFRKLLDNRNTVDTTLNTFWENHFGFKFGSTFHKVLHNSTNDPRLKSLQ